MKRGVLTPLLVATAALAYQADPLWAPCCPPTLSAETHWRSDATTIYYDPFWITADGLGNVYEAVDKPLGGLTQGSCAP